MPLINDWAKAAKAVRSDVIVLCHGGPIIKADSYFSSDETHVKQVDCVDSLKDVGHGVQMIHKGVSGKTHNQLFECFSCYTMPHAHTRTKVSISEPFWCHG